MGAPTPFLNMFGELSIGSLRYNTAQAGQAIPVLWGTGRVGANVIEFWGFGGGPGKTGAFNKGGGGSKGGGKKGANYSVDVAFAICQGPVSFTGSKYSSGNNNRIWANAGIAYGPASVDLVALAGNDGQAPTPTWSTNDPNTPVLGYSGTAYCVGEPMQLGSSPALPNISFEIGGFERGTIAPANFPDDANPSSIIIDMLSNSRYGAGFNPSLVDATGTLADYGTYCWANGLAMSLLMDRCQATTQWLQEIVDNTSVAIFWSGALLKVVPYSTATITGNGTTWTPNLSPIYHIGDNQLLDWGGDSDPVIVTRVDPQTLPNFITMEYWDSSNNFNPNIVYSFDQGEIDDIGLRIQPGVEGHCFTNITTAKTAVQLMLQRKQMVRRKFKFQLGFWASLLEPMDIIAVTDVNAGLVSQLVRITSVEEDADTGNLQFEAEELPALTTPPPAYGTVTPTSATPSPNTPLTSGANTPIIFEPDGALTNNQLEAWVASSGTDPHFGGANVYLSTDGGSSYANVGSIFTGTPQGVLTGNLAAYVGANPDTTNTLSIDLSESRGQLVSTNPTGAANYQTLCYCNGELLAFQTATLTGTFAYNLTTLYRGLFGTSAAMHSSGSLFAFFGIQSDPPGVFKYSYPANLIGTTISIKLQAFNNYGVALQDISTLPAYTYTLTGAGQNNSTNVPITSTGVVTNGVPILNFTFGDSVSFPINFTGSVCSGSVNATSTITFTIAKNGASIGTMTVTSGTKTGTFSVASATTFMSGDILTITPTSTDATLANMTGNLVGTLV